MTSSGGSASSWARDGDGLGQGVFALLLQAAGQLQQLLLGKAGRRAKVRHPGRADGDGACLIQGDDLRLPRALQGGGGLKQNAVLGPDAVADHDGHRRGKAQRTGAADDEHRDAPGQRVADGLACQQPDDRRHRRDGDDHRDKHAGDA